MRYTKIPLKIKSSDDIHDLNGIIYVPIGSVKATVQIIHGVCEHIELYDEFMSRLAQNGIVCFAHDQLGHGRTARNFDELGFFASENGVEHLVDDACKFACECISDYNTKHFIFGHSMGTFTTRICCEKYPQIADGIILAGTSGHQPAAPIGIAVTDIKSMIQGSEHRSESTQRMFFDIYNYVFRAETDDYSWLSTLPEVIESHKNDEYFNFTFSIKAMNDIVRLCNECNSEEWFANFPKIPSLIISGEHDPLGNFGKGVLEVYKKLKDTSPSTFKLYRNARHELLHEYCTETVISDIISWINTNI